MSHFVYAKRSIGLALFMRPILRVGFGLKAITIRLMGQIKRADRCWNILQIVLEVEPVDICIYYLVLAQTNFP